MNEKIILIGSGGHCKSLIDSIQMMDIFDIVGLIDTKNKKGTQVNGIEVIGEDDNLESYFKKGIKNLAIGIGSIGNVNLRLRLYTICKNIGYTFPNIIDPTAILSKNLIIGEANFIGKGSIINTNVSVGNGCILNTGCIVDHDCILDDFVHIAPGCVLSGHVFIGKYSHIGTHSTLIQNISIGTNCLIGAGSLVLKNINHNQIAYGNPCKEVRIHEKNYDYSRSRCES